ncbi:hypothetical protein M5K25_019331 [Dendrobium thyrsiflorum]|uniref:Uncharacterized protein n=1 Tax=Dendrobium thyrsiflorum TaxID=117978 RepID=A0ABD0UEH9_DENTH
MSLSDILDQALALCELKRNFGSLPASPPFKGKSERLAFPSSPRGRFRDLGDMAAICNGFDMYMEFSYNK